MIKILSFILCFFLSGSLFAASTIDLPIDDPAYQYIDLLESHRLIDTRVHGHAPYSRGEIARIVLEARKNWDIKSSDESGKKAKWIEEILSSLEKEFELDIRDYNRGQGFKQGRRLDVSVIDSAAAQFTVLDSASRIFPANNGTGTIDAKVTPFVQNRGGRHYQDGKQFAVETQHWANLSPYFSLFAQPRLQFQYSGNPEHSAFVQELYAVAELGNVSLKVGRSSLALGQGPHGGLILSDNARPRDQIVLSNDHPFRFPWIFKHLGYVKFTSYFANLGPESFFDDTILAGYKLSLKPHRNFEFGLSNAMQIGGDGAPTFSAGDFLGDFVGFAGTSQSKSNRILGLDARVTLPFLRSSQIYGEVFFDDKTTESLKRTFVDTSAYYGGVFVPRLNDSGTFHGRAEFRYISELFYRHSQFRSGFTQNRHILGDPLGPDGRSVHVALGYDLNLDHSLEADLFYDWSSANSYRLTGTSSTVLASSPTEKRARGVVSYKRRWSDLVKTDVKFGYERVNNFNYVSGNGKNNFLFEFNLGFDWKNGLVFSQRD